MLWVQVKCPCLIDLIMSVIYLDDFTVIGTYCDKKVFFDGCRKDSVTLIIDVLAYDVDSAWGAGYELGFTVIDLLKFGDEGIIARDVGGRV